jgi:Protein of unknown function (DUF2865)
MAARRRLIHNLVLLAAVALTAAPLEAASAQNFFQQLFGVLRHRAPVSERVFTDPFSAFARAVSPPPAREERTMGSAFCVRTCDGYHFVVHGNANASTADMCHALCPGSETRLFSGSNIDYATASDGSRYADLATADAIAGNWSPVAPATVAMPSASRTSTRPKTPRLSPATWWRPKMGWWRSPARGTRAQILPRCRITAAFPGATVTGSPN